MMIAGGTDVQTAVYGSITLEQPVAADVGVNLGAGNTIASLAKVGINSYILLSNGAAGARMIRLIVGADGAISSQSLVQVLAGDATDSFAIAGTSPDEDCLILRDTGAAITMQRYRDASNDLIALAEAQLVDLDTMNAPAGMARHDGQNVLVIDNTAQGVPALYALEVTANAVASIASLGTITAMSGLTAAAIMIDTPGEAVIAADNGRMWRVFYGLATGIGGAAAMSRPNGLLAAVSALTPLPTPGAASARWMDVADFGTSERVAVTAATADGDRDTATISRLRAGSDAITVISTNEAIVLPASDTGVVSTYVGAGGEIRVYRGVTRLTTGVSFTRVAVTSNLGATVDANTGAYAVTNLADGAVSENLVIRVEVDGFTIDKIITVTKANQGPRGSGTYSRAITGTAWSNAQANAATPGANQLGDRVTLYNSAARFSETRFWTGLAWEVLVQIIDGSLVVTGTIGVDKLVANWLTAIRINANQITAGLITADQLAANVFNAITINANQITAGTLNVNRIDAVDISAITGSFDDLEVTGRLSADVLNVVPIYIETGVMRIVNNPFLVEVDEPVTDFDSLLVFGASNILFGGTLTRKIGFCSAIKVTDIVTSSLTTSLPSTANGVTGGGSGSGDFGSFTVWRNTSTRLRFRPTGVSGRLYGVWGIRRD